MSGYTVKPPTGDTNEQTQFIDYFNLFYSKRGQEQISISQQLGNYGTTFFSASRQSYWNTSRSDQQISFGLNVPFGDITTSLNYSYSNNIWQNDRDHLLAFTLNVPFSHWMRTDSQSAFRNFNAQIGGKVLMTLKYGNKSVPFGAIVTHGENKNGSIVAENGQVYLTGLPQSGQLQVSWGKDKNSNCIVEYKLPEVSPGTLLNQQTAICR